jgi:hypothetical protein
VHQSADVLLEAGFDDVFSDLNVPLMEILPASPRTDSPRAMDDGLDVVAQGMHPFRITQVALNEFGATPHQMLNALCSTGVDPDAQPLLQGETREASTDEAARAGDQNLHLPLRSIKMHNMGSRGPVLQVAGIPSGGDLYRSEFISRYGCSNAPSSQADQAYRE